MKLSAIQIEQIAQRTAELLSEKIYRKPHKNLGVSDDLLTRKELSDYLKISESTLWRYEKENRLHSYSISGRRYFKKSEVENFLIKKTNNH